MDLAPFIQKWPKSFRNCKHRDHSAIVQMQPPGGWKATAILSQQHYLTVIVNIRDVHDIFVCMHASVHVVGKVADNYDMIETNKKLFLIQVCK